MNTSEQKIITLLKTENLSWKVKDKLILNDLSLSLNEGEFVGVIGPNGAGKSSLLRCLYSNIKPTSGVIHFNQKTLNQYSRRQLAQNIAVVLQEAPSHFDLTVIDVIRMGLIPTKKLLSFESQDDIAAINKALKDVDLDDKSHQSFNSLSGGEKQRAMIARAILQSPKLLLMDEPTNHLDIRHQIEVLKLAQSMAITVMVTIHDLNLAAAFCDRLILLDEGKIVAQGSPEKVLTKAILKQVFKVDAEIEKQKDSTKLRIHFNLSTLPLVPLRQENNV